MQLIASAIFTPFMMIWTVFWGLVYCTFCPFMPWRARFWMVGGMTRPVLFALRVLCGLKHSVEGLENLPKDGQHVLYVKHSSTWETYAMMILFRPLVWVMKREILWIPFVGWGCMLARCIAIDRKAGASAVNQVIAQGKSRMNKLGAWVLVFPEGTRMAAGETRRYGASGALLAIQQGCKIVPVAHNAGHFWPRRGLLKRRGTIRVVIGPPIDAKGRDARELNDEAQRWIESNIRPPEG